MNYIFLNLTTTDIGEDSDQMLFLPHKDKKTSATGGVLRFLHDKTANNEVNRRVGRVFLSSLTSFKN